MIYEEIKDLKSIHFSPDVRYDFVIIKNELKKRAHSGSHSEKQGKSIDLSNRLIEILKKYNGVYEINNQEKFIFLSDIELKNIVQRDYLELSVILFPEGAWKSVVIMCGSILEAILFDILSNQENIDNTNASSKAPIRNNQIVRIDQGNGWKLQKLIEVAVDTNILPEKRSLSIDQVLRDYRNFVHPKREIRSEHQCSEAEALMAKGSIDGVINHLIITQNT